MSMTNKSSPSTDKKSTEKHPGMLGDGTEEQNLNQPGKAGARINKAEVTAAFEKKPSHKT
jgi:hypothetical protein